MNAETHTPTPWILERVFFGGPGGRTEFYVTAQPPLTQEAALGLGIQEVGKGARLALSELGERVLFAVLPNDNAHDSKVEANAEFVVLACNAHAGLVRALNRLADAACIVQSSHNAGVKISERRWAVLQNAQLGADATLVKARGA